MQEPQEKQVQSPGQEDPLEEEVQRTPVGYSCQDNPTDRGAWRAAYSPWGRKELGTTERKRELPLPSSVTLWAGVHQLPSLSLSFLTGVIQDWNLPHNVVMRECKWPT